MTYELYILGTDHCLQCGSTRKSKYTTDQINIFEKELRKICSEKKIARIEEEMSCNGLKRYEVDETIGHRISIELKIEHRYVDLDVKERQELSLCNPPVWSCFLDNSKKNAFSEAFYQIAYEVRERVWLTKLLEDGKKWPVLFICGSNHVINFQELSGRLGVIKSEVLYDDYDF